MRIHRLRTSFGHENETRRTSFAAQNETRVRPFSLPGGGHLARATHMIDQEAAAASLEPIWLPIEPRKLKRCSS